MKTTSSSRRTRVLVCCGWLAVVPPAATTAGDGAGSGCTESERRDALRAMQSAVLAAAPDRIPSMRQALAPGGPLAGWRLAHGYVVLAGAGAVGVDNLAAREPQPPLLLYAPSDTSTPGTWLDFDGPDDPYRLVGWAYIGPYTEGSTPPERRCITASEWMVHEAGWHLRDGNMRLTPGAAVEPPRPPDLPVLMWHPRIWDLHAWRGADGVARITPANPDERPGGLALPAAAFLQMKNGRLQPLSPGQ
jgi:hypothetical protein